MTSALKQQTQEDDEDEEDEEAGGGEAENPNAPVGKSRSRDVVSFSFKPWRRYKSCLSLSKLIAVDSTLVCAFVKAFYSDPARLRAPEFLS